jgi:hypothetical protein
MEAPFDCFLLFALLLMPVLFLQGNHMYGQILCTSLQGCAVRREVFLTRKFLCTLSRISFRPVESIHGLVYKVYHS